MDKQTADALAQQLTQQAQPHTDPSGQAVPRARKPLYVQDLEERAAQQGTTVEKVYEHDQQLLSRVQPTSDCLRPEEVMMCARDEEGLPHRAWEHYQQCSYCHGLVDLARPDAARYRELVTQLAEVDKPQADPPAAPIVQWTAAIFAKLDKGVASTVKNGTLIVVCFLVIFYLSPDWLRTKAPTWAWTESQLELRARHALQAGDLAKADALSSELIKREPRNPGWYMLRYQARVLEGKKELASDDHKAAVELLHSPGAPWDLPGPKGEAIPPPKPDRESKSFAKD